MASKAHVVVKKPQTAKDMILIEIIDFISNKSTKHCSLLSASRYREAGVSDWSTIPVTPSGSTQVTINRLTPGTTYEFQVIGKNALGDGMLSKVITIRTLGESPCPSSYSRPDTECEITTYVNIRSSS